MEEIVKISSIAQYTAMRSVPTQHPLVAVLDLSHAQPMPTQSFQFGLYAVGLKELHQGQLRYGRKHYDYQEGSLIFLAPGQVVGVEPGEELFAPKGWALLFHPDLLLGTPLGKRMLAYSFFSYEVSEALHLSQKEKQLVLECFAKIAAELAQTIDKHSKGLITANIELLLQYCLRFYDRQFLTRDTANQGILERFEALLRTYFAADKPQHAGLPSVAYCAQALHLSPNYFGDLVKKETGSSAQDYIQAKVIAVAKERLFDRQKSASEIAYELGFRYPQHFTRLFKQRTGVTPSDYRIGK
jgi:AraC family transcriptional activator of pobA